MKASATPSTGPTSIWARNTTFRPCRFFELLLRAAAHGAALRRAIEDMPGNLRVAVLGSGGLWHTPMAPHAVRDVEFDQAMLEGLTRGDAKSMAAYFDGRRPVVNPDDPKSLNLARSCHCNPLAG